ncbi:arylsulfatase/uncharacterized sulfatase [Roseibium hamelinense]|uniref:Arylsulfatase/uncharacterized sulfatase n=1 Tax=Roseibium hamelinense TaxID=150831 RepID=A0A562SDD7_9HYPH|nr:arylsulfatase [Roseibium hamelinense]MTI42088.1 arylsulfatase [Roseibium hamelinense]TWI78696.1 arylsulfatase/uncharacterized sulfatase [Roseibium hamelinense]
MIGPVWTTLCAFAMTALTALPAQAQQERPNILLVVLDDAGFMDFGAYGSDTQTPNIDQLSSDGAMFTRFYATPQCGPSRAMLLTGQDNHSIGMGSIAEVMNDEMRALPAYSLKWADSQHTIASLLQEGGYQTFASGKWGIGHIGENLPNRFGFDRSWVLDSTGSSNFNTKSYLPIYKEMKWFEDGARVSLPEDFYSSRNIVDKMIEYVDERDPDRPFFGYLSFQAIHIPLQVSTEYIDKYNGVFDRGWDVMREERLQRAIEMNLVPETTKLAEWAYNARDWDALSEDEKAYWARVMQVNAGMMENADHHLGRLLNHLDAEGALDNTIVVVLSDNGPESATLGETSELPTLLIEKAFMLLEGWNTDYNNLGQRGSIAAIGSEWASVSAAPLHLFKFSAGEGGMRVPFVIAGPGISPLGIANARAQIADIAPTLLDAARVDYADDIFHGRSLMPILSGTTDAVYGDDDSMPFEVSGTAALYRGNWKITKTPTPFGDGKWNLYDLSVDPGETNNVGADHPDLFEDMLAEYAQYAEQAGVYEFGPGESARQQLIENSVKKIFSNYAYLVIGFLIAALAVLYVFFRWVRAMVRRARA